MVRYITKNETEPRCMGLRVREVRQNPKVFMRIVGELLEAGYADAITIGIITESALDESVVSLFDDIFAEYIDEKESKAKYRKLKTGQEIFFKGFHPSKKLVS